jgi:hypothetical protein
MLTEKDIYNQDGLITIHNHDFMLDPGFVAAYQRGVQATGRDYSWHWRVHIGLWAASSASRLDGDFIECGVNKGFMSSAIMKYLNWDSLNKKFYLLDTFCGLDSRYVSAQEIQAGALKKNCEHLETDFYVSDIRSVISNFSEWNNVCIIKGPIPETLAQVDAKTIAFLHIDLNCSPPEVAALDSFWDRLVPGAYILLDDYAYQGYYLQKVGMDAFARNKSVMIASLPTGQGLLMKPPA